MNMNTRSRSGHRVNPNLPFHGLILLSVIAWAPSVLSEPGPQPHDPHWKQSVEQVVEEYIRTHPEVVEQSLQALKATRQAEEQQRVRATIAARQDELLRDPSSPVGGNPTGAVTIVEFFDYRCKFCKHVAPILTQLQKDDAQVRIIYKDYPILGDASVIAAKAAMASRTQGKHLAFHEALLIAKSSLTKTVVFQIAKEVGLDLSQLERDMENPEWEKVIERNHALGKALGISGTPAFVIGNELHPGAIELPILKEYIQRARTP